MSAVTLAVSVPSAPDEGTMVVMTWASVRSTSVKAMVPLSVRLPAGVTASSTVPVRSDVATTGSSLVPVMVTSMVRLMMPPLQSSSLTVNCCTLVWSLARFSTAEAGTL